MVPNSSLIILFLIIIIFPFTIEQNSLDDYYNGVQNNNNINGDELEDNDCLCDINPWECDFHCCCDENCQIDAIEDWENHSKCINEQNTPKLSDDKCIDKNLFAWYYNFSKEYPKRGLHLETQTEDIPKKSGSINNLCFSIDNSKSKDIITLDDLEKYGYKSIDKLYDDIFDLYIEPYFIKNNKENSASVSGTSNTLRRTSTDDGTKGIDIENKNENNQYFEKNGKFSLSSGTNCENRNIIEKWTPKNYSCLMNKDKNPLKANSFEKEIKIKDTVCKIYKEYKIVDKLLSEITKDLNNNLFVLQVEFILIINPVKSDIGQCYINLVVCQDSEIGSTFTFKNSVIFANNENEPYTPYTYSGNIGYLNGYPLKIYFKDKVYNDFYIVGRDKDGYCRTGEDLLSYLYFSDKPLLFNEDYTYSCKLSPTNISVKDTILYKKIIGITKIAKYGSSDYSNIDNEDWIAVNTDNVKSITVENNKHYVIKMNIKFKTEQKKGFYSHKYINDISFSIDKPSCDEDCLVKLEIKFFGDDESNDTKYKKKPDIPFFIPNIPDDILDPFINPDVDK
jgi:hypothetical protein